LKRKVFAQLERCCRPGTILATNTSYLDPRQIFRPISDRTRTIGLHFFSPAHVMKLLEVIPLPHTSDTTKAAAHELARRLGKTPVVAGICEGFIGNRMLRRYRRAAEALVCRGNPPAAVDAAMRDYGFAMGPFEAQDMAGLDVAYRALEAARAAGQAIPVGPVDLLVGAGRTGQKAGGGWYDYWPGERTPRPSPQADAILAPLVATHPPLPSKKIAGLLVEAMAEEGDAILREGIAASAADIDLVQALGYGFPRHRGGPMFATGRLDATDEGRLQ
jgi:3-hydroxyacyl-CoA dehydrogenase